MSELLERSVEASRADSREYLYGTIISQLVPDEARILAALVRRRRSSPRSTSSQKQRRGTTRSLLANASAVGRQAGLVAPDNTPTYLTRLQGFGLVEFGPEDQELSRPVRHPGHRLDRAGRPQRRGAPAPAALRLERKTLPMSAFGARLLGGRRPVAPAPCRSA